MDITILTRRFPGTLPFEEIDGIPVYRLPMSPLKPVSSLMYTIFAVGFISYRLRPDVIHANEFISPATTALLAKYLLGIPIVITPHRSGPPGDVQRLKERRGGFSRLNALREQADAFVVISQDIGIELSEIEIPNARMRFISNGVDTTRFAPVEFEHKVSIRKTLGISTDALVIIFAGRLVSVKRIDALLTIWPVLRSRFSQAELLLIGTGEQEFDLLTDGKSGCAFPWSTKRRSS